LRAIKPKGLNRIDSLIALVHAMKSLNSVMIINSTNINKWTITSRLNWIHWTQKRPKHMTLEMQILD